MDAPFDARKQALLEECEVAPQVFERVMPRLERFMEPLIESLGRTEQVQHARTFVQGLLSDLDRKNTESIAYRFGQERMPLQWFIGVSDWDGRPLRSELVRQVGQTLGAPDSVIVFDPSAFPKSGKASVGVARQWCGRLGKVDNCQVAVYMGYASSREHALVDLRLYLPKEWTTDRARREKAGIPKDVRYRTRHQLCLEMLAEHGAQLPHQWIAGDDEMGRPYWFRKRLDRLDEQYLLSVPSHTLIRYKDRDDQTVVKTDYDLSNASPDTGLSEFARVAKAEHRIEQCLQRGKSEAGLADYEVRHWKGWHHHQTLSLIASWFLLTEAGRGKKWTPAITVPQIQAGIAAILHRRSGCATPSRILHERRQRLERNELARLYHWKRRNRLAPLNVNKRQI
ncbi:MAG: IS701 family transposase [Planctomycetaceae bacterium]